MLDVGLHKKSIMFSITFHFNLSMDYTLYDMWDEITDPFINFNSATVEV